MKTKYITLGVAIVALIAVLVGCTTLAANLSTDMVSNNTQENLTTSETMVYVETEEQIPTSTEETVLEITGADDLSDKNSVAETEIVTETITEPEEFVQLDLEENPFFDSLVYTGYNIEKHRADGMMWYYLLASQKRGRGWLSNITYAGGSTGYETTEDGSPDISFFEKHGLVCASYVTYVYFNYMPNVVGIDTSELTKPEKSYSANDWYVAAKDWVDKGYSKKIDFEASLTNAGFIDFSTEEEIPIGSIIAFCDAKNKSDYCSHVVIYAGYENNYHWVYHVGNENGPEFCSVQRMHFGPDPQWPIAVITTPDMVWENLQ